MCHEEYRDIDYQEEEIVMQAMFVGVGEAFDEHYPNASILVSFGSAGNQRHVLLDCGFTAAAAYYAHADVGADLDSIWISHYHGDHFLGLPLLLLRFWEEGRTKPLTILGQAGLEQKIWAAFELAYPSFRQRLDYPVHCHEVAAGNEVEALGAKWNFAENDHNVSAPCLAVRIDYKGKSVFYSGDGRPTTSTLSLANGVDLLIHEAYGMASDTPGHGGVRGCLEMAQNAAANHLALVHVNRRVRREHARTIREMLDAEFGPQGILPEPGASVAL